MGPERAVGLQPPALFGAALEVQTDWRVVAFTSVVTIGCGVLFGLIPALRASRTDLSSQLREGDRNASGGGGHLLRNGLVAGQVCLSLVALVGAGLFLRALGEAGEVHLGFEAEGLTLVSVDLVAQGYSEDEGRLFYRDSVERLSALRGVESVAVGSLRPLTFGSLRSILGEDEDPQDPGAGRMVRETLATPGYFETVGVSLLRGRALLPSDDVDGPPVAAVNERMAEMFWPGQYPVGRRFEIGLPPTSVTVVGVVETSKQVTIAEDPAPEYVMPE